MPLVKYKQKCNICKNEWVVINYREFPICVKCQMKQAFSEEITDKKYDFLNIEKEWYEKSRFLRNIRISYLRFRELTEKQTEAFKKVLNDLKNPPSEDKKNEENTNNIEQPDKRKKNIRKPQHL